MWIFKVLSEGKAPLIYTRYGYLRLKSIPNGGAIDARSVLAIFLGKAGSKYKTGYSKTKSKHETMWLSNENYIVYVSVLSHLSVCKP